MDDPGQPCIIDGEVPEDADDLSCKAWIIYDDEYLYVAVAVIDWDWVNAVDTNEEDGNTWNDDSVEVFVDGNHNRVEGDVNDHPEEYETGGQFVITSSGARRDVEAGNPTFGDTADAEWFAAVLENDDFTGFNYEFRIKLSKIGNPKKGDTVGFNLAINDADTSPGQRDTQFVWLARPIRKARMEISIRTSGSYRASHYRRNYHRWQNGRSYLGSGGNG